VVEAHARRIEVPRSIAAASSDAASAFALPIEGSGTQPRTAGQWARAVFEGAPPLLRWCILFGWRFILGLRLQPLDADGQVLGWTVEATAAGPDTVTLAAASRLLRAENVVAVDGTVVVWVTVVHYETSLARPLWAVASALHHLVLRYLLGRAAGVRDPWGKGREARGPWDQAVNGHGRAPT
jgi:hypothetical protein